MGTIAQAIQYQRANKENRFYTNLMQYAMEGNQLPMPNKSALWNQFVQMKGGRLSPQDIAQFEQTYAQVSGAKFNQQMVEYQKMSMGGMSDKEIKQSIKDNPIKYKNLLDMIAKFEQSGTEEGLNQAARARRFIPDVDEGGVLGNILERKTGLFGQLAIPAALMGGPYAYKYMRGRGAQAVEDVTREFKSARRVVTSDMNANRKALKSNKTDLKKDLSKKRKTVKVKENIKNLKSENRRLNKEYKDLSSKRSDIKIKDPGKRYKRFLKKSGRPGFGTALAAQYIAPEVGEFIGGESAREKASLLTNIGLLGSGILYKNPATAITGGLGLGYNIYDYLTGDEE